MASRHRYLRAGSGPGGTGIAILEFPNRSSLTIFVVPKFWATAPFRAEVDLDRLTVAPQDFALVVPEFAIVQFASRDADLLADCIAKLAGLRFDEPADDEDVQEIAGDPVRRLSPLFIETVRPAGFANLDRIEPTHNQANQSVRRYWAGIEEVDATDLVKLAEGSDLDSPVLLGRQLIRSIPGLQMALWRLFVSETELALRRRTPDFRGRKEVLPFVRGALTRKGRFNASVGDRSRLECDFSELDNDHDWQRLIRAGIRETANQLRTSTHDRATAELLLRCRRVDIRMADVSVLNRSNARRIDLNIGRLGKNRHAVHAARLAAAVLGEPAGLGAAGRIPRETAIATGLRVSTPLLFERMLAGCLPADFGFQLVTNGEAVALRSSEPARKVPDLLLVPAAVALPSVRSAIAVVDAKYKMRVPALMSQMGMADQYQQFAYAVVSRRPTLFLYAASPDASAALLDSRLTNSPEPAQHLGLAAIPFPGPTEQSWRSALGSSLLGPIAEFAIRIEAHLRQPA